MPDNLTIGIGADTSKLRADLTKAQAELRNFSQQLRQAGTEQNAAQISELSQRYEIASRAVRGLSVQIAQAYRVMDQTEPLGRATRAIQGLHGAFARFGQGVQQMAREVLPAFSQSLGVAFGGAGLGTALAGIDQVRKNLIDAQNISKATNFDPQFIIAFKEAIRETGQDAEIAGPALFRFQEQAAKARMAALQAGQIPGGPTVFRGTADALKGVTNEVTTLRGGVRDLTAAGQTMVQVFHGDQKQVFDLKDGFKTLAIEAANFSAATKDQDRLLTLVIQRMEAFKKAGRIDEANIAAMDLFGKKFTELAAALEKFQDPTTKLKFMKELLATGLMPSAADFAKAEQYDKALDQLSKTLRGLQQQVGVSLFPNLSQELAQETKDVMEMERSLKSAWTFIQSQMTSEFMVQQVKEIKDLWAGLGWFFKTLWAEISDDAKAAWPVIVQAAVEAYNLVTQAWAPFKPFFDNLFAGAWDQLKKLGRALAQPVGKVADSPEGFAAGGHVPGIGTGDIVPALLTPGEFVNRLSSVRHYGVDVFRALNAQRIPRDLLRGYAMGGLVDSLHAPVRGFADGGLVSAADGRSPVHLHLGGHQFPLQGSSGVVDALVVEAGRYQMRSGGLKPSWYGGRPNG
jgi:hypothetical protein